MSLFIFMNMMVLSLKKMLNDVNSMFMCTIFIVGFIIDMNKGNYFLFKIFYIDSMSYLMVMLSVWIIMFVFIINKLKNNMFDMFVCMINVMLIMCFLSDNIIMFYMFFEAVLLPMFFIILIWGGQLERFTAGVYMIMYTLVGSLPLLVIFVFMSKWLTMSMVYLFFMKKINFNMLVSMLLFMAFLIKLPMFGFHSWLPKAHVEAPVSGSMLLAGILLKLGGYGLYRFIQMLFWGGILDLQLVLIIISLFGGIYVSSLCLGVVDLKMLIAYSSVVHMGYVISGLVSGTFMVNKGVSLMLISHGLCSSCLFCLVDFYYKRFYTRNIFMLKGMMLVFPSMTMWWFMFSIINMGAPPFMNFFSEFFLMSILMKFSSFLMLLMMIVIFLSSFYCMFMYSYTQHGKIIFLKSVKMMCVLEYDICFYHMILLFIFIFKMSMFMVV